MTKTATTTNRSCQRTLVDHLFYRHRFQRSGGQRSRKPSLLHHLFMLLVVASAGRLQAQTDAPAPVELQPAEVPAEVSAMVIESAQTSLIKNAFIAAPISGVIASMEVTEGQWVEPETVLLHLQSDLAEHELIAARAALDAARLESDNDVNLRFAQRTLQMREHELKQSHLANQTFSGAVSEMEIEEVLLKVDQATLAIEQARHELMIATAAAAEKEAAVSIAQSQLKRHTVSTTVSGMVTQIDAQAGEWVEAGKPLVRIISLNPLRVEGLIDGTKHGAELVGRAVRFLPQGSAEFDAPSADLARSVSSSDTAASDIVLSGTISFVSRELHPVTGQVRLWATIDNPGEKIGSGVSGKLIVD